MSQPIRLLLPIADLGGGGTERQFSLLARCLSRERFELHVCFWRDVFKYACPEDVTVHRIEKSRPWHVLRAIRQTRDLIDEIEPRLIFSQLHYVNLVTGTALARSRHRASWICRQANDPRRKMKGPFAVWARWSLNRADRVVGCSEGVRRELIDHLCLDPDRVVKLDNIADVDEIDRLCEETLPLTRPSDSFVVVHAGRLHHQKNQALLLEAFSRFRGQPVELWMLGEGPLENGLRAQTARLGLERQVRWLGFQTNPFPFFRAADCLALSSDYEGLPNVVIEAMICGTPVVSTRCPFGPDELIEDGVDGFLVPVGDAVAFSEALRKLVDHPDLASSIGAAARCKAAERFHPGRTCAAYEDLFERVARE